MSKKPHRAVLSSRINSETGDNARKFLARNPTQDDIQEAYEWTFEDAALGDDSPQSLAYDEAYRKVLRPHLI